MNVVHDTGEDAVVELGNAFHDPKVSFCCTAENLQGCLVRSAIVSRQCLLEVFEFRHDYPLLQTRFARFDSFGRPN